MEQNITQSTSFTKIFSSRKVCVLNMHDQPYKEDFKGEVITIPPLGARKVFMPAWKASKFLASCAAPPAHDYTGEAIRGGAVKMLRISELTPEEKLSQGEDSSEVIQKKQMAADKALGLFCGMCGYKSKDSADLKSHTAFTHPEAVPVE